MTILKLPMMSRKRATLAAREGWNKRTVLQGVFYIERVKRRVSLGTKVDKIGITLQKCTKFVTSPGTRVRWED